VGVHRLRLHRFCVHIALFCRVKLGRGMGLLVLGIDEFLLCIDIFGKLRV